MKANMTSFLSANVRHMIVELDREFEESLSKTEICRGFGSDGEILVELARLGGTNRNALHDFQDDIKRLLPICKKIDSRLLQMPLESFIDNYGKDVGWTGCENKLMECFEFIKSGDHILLLTAMLLITSSLEHCMGDVYLMHSKDSQCPKHLKDLLYKKELEEVFNEDVMQCLRMLIGPPGSLNLRNVLWHGFVVPTEIPRKYAITLLYLVVLMGRTLRESCAITLGSAPRPLILFPKESLLYEVFPSLSAKELTPIKCLVSGSAFVSSNMTSIWIKALEFFEHQRFELMVTLLLPQLEHALRQVFACVNNCTYRALTADSATLYTTFDEILAETLPDGTTNSLRSAAGDTYMDILLDMLVYPDGPRVRDRVSHGEASLTDFPQLLANHVLCVCVAFAIRFYKKVKGSKAIDDNDLKSGGSKVTSMRKCDGFQWNENTGREQEHRTCASEHVQQPQGNPPPCHRQQQQETQQHITIGTSQSKNSGYEDETATVYPCYLSIVDRQSSKETQSGLLDNLSNGVIGTILDAAEKYESIFHPIQALKRRIKKFLQFFEKFENIPIPEDEDFDNGSFVTESADSPSVLRLWLDLHRVGSGYSSAITRQVSNASRVSLNSISDALAAPLEKSCTDLYDSIVSAALVGRVTTLYRTRPELEIVSLFCSIIDRCLATAEQVLAAVKQRHAQWINKELHSRQRANYKRLRAHLPFIRDTLKLTVGVVAQHLADLTLKALPGNRKQYIKSLKRIQQCSQNMESLSGPSKNRWDECRDVAKRLADVIAKQFV
ncbi:endoplasmic reticulum membrane-associated RNA degradation protein-like [Nematostella vectensis]|uniref:endoplasmic reticulum membrane-associated RNA degradation protein-like n=1 Tax=Nematostella vectensis TaxID=45351 RepID=UPI0020772122|nr:endoplasmic reticulum membrane-associated RNA degradation protein-like [Nematostella vectensis]